MTPLTQPAKPVFFPGLNGIRFLAALTVIVQHLEILKNRFHFRTVIAHPAGVLVGGYGVTLFFTLSGFLITYLLFAEKTKYQTIAIQDFYVRRILRIWPLYYFLLFLAIAVLPLFSVFRATEDSYAGFYQHLGSSLPWYVFLLANVPYVTGHAIPYVVQLWSVACEEQFYLVWPHLIKHTTHYLLLFFLVIAGSLFVANAASYANFHYHAHLSAAVSRALVFVQDFLYYFRISAMAIGGLGAYALYFQRQAVLRLVYALPTQVLSLLGIAFIIGWRGTIPYAHHAVLAGLFIIVILNVATNPRSLLKLRGNVLDYLGGISYGFYMYHLIAISLMYGLVTKLFAQAADSSLANYVLYAGSIALTIAFAHLSYRYLETPCLRLKKRFTRVKNTDGLT